MSTYDIDSGVPKKLPANPLTLWDWGIEYRTGLLRRPDPELVKINLLPHTNATVTEHGLKLFGCYYSCKQALEWGWFEENYRGTKTVTVAYDLYSTNMIYLRPSDSYAEFIPANLTSRSRAYADITVWELWVMQDIRLDLAASSKLKKRSGSVNLVNDLQQIKDNPNSNNLHTQKLRRQKELKVLPRINGMKGSMKGTKKQQIELCHLRLQLQQLRRLMVVAQGTKALNYLLD